MKHYPLAVFSDHSEVHFDLSTAARLARVSEKFVHLCERKELITCHIILSGEMGLRVTDISKLKIIRHLHEDMGLDLEAVDFVLRYRNRIQTMKRRMDEMARRMQRREAKYGAEIQILRRQLSQLSDGYP
jgi:hypothetical protein